MRGKGELVCNYQIVVAVEVVDAFFGFCRKAPSSFRKADGSGDTCFHSLFIVVIALYIARRFVIVAAAQGIAEIVVEKGKAFVFLCSLPDHLLMRKRRARSGPGFAVQEHMRIDLLCKRNDLIHGFSVD